MACLSYVDGVHFYRKRKASLQKSMLQAFSVGFNAGRFDGVFCKHKENLFLFDTDQRWRSFTPHVFGRASRMEGGILRGVHMVGGISGEGILRASTIALIPLRKGQRPRKVARSTGFVKEGDLSPEIRFLLNGTKFDYDGIIGF